MNTTERDERESEAELLQQASEELAQVHTRIGPRFRRAEARERARGFLQGLLAPVERKNGWQLAEELGERGPRGVQRLLGEADWDEEGVRDDLQAYVIEHLGEDSGVLVVDETGFVKKGKKSAGVARQYSGTAGRKENSQVGVFLLYAGSKGAAFLDRALYLPEEWVGDRVRCREAGIPDDVKRRVSEADAVASHRSGRPSGVGGRGYGLWLRRSTAVPGRATEELRGGGSRDASGLGARTPTAGWAARRALASGCLGGAFGGRRK